MNGPVLSALYGSKQPMFLRPACQKICERLRRLYLRHIKALTLFCGFGGDGMQAVGVDAVCIGAFGNKGHKVRDTQLRAHT